MYTKFHNRFMYSHCATADAIGKSNYTYFKRYSKDGKHRLYVQYYGEKLVAIFRVKTKSS